MKISIISRVIAFNAIIVSHLTASQNITNDNIYTQLPITMNINSSISLKKIPKCSNPRVLMSRGDLFKQLVQENNEGYKKHVIYKLKLLICKDNNTIKTNIMSINSSIALKEIPKCSNAKVLINRANLFNQLVQENNEGHKKHVGYTFKLLMCKDNNAIKTHIKLVQNKIVRKYQLFGRNLKIKN